MTETNAHTLSRKEQKDSVNTLKQTGRQTKTLLRLFSTQPLIRRNKHELSEGSVHGSSFWLTFAGIASCLHVSACLLGSTAGMFVFRLEAFMLVRCPQGTLRCSQFLPLYSSPFHSLHESCALTSWTSNLRGERCKQETPSSRP